MGSRRFTPILGLPVLCFGLAACESETFDTTREVDTSKTLGEMVFEIFHRDFRKEDQRVADGFQLEHDAFVGGLDHLFPPSELSYTQAFLVKLLPLQDDGTLPDATRMLSQVTARMAQDPDVARSVAALFERVGYVDLEHETALVRRIAGYPEYRRLAKAILKLALEHDGLDATGRPDANENAALQTLMRRMATRMTEMEVSEDTERGVVLAADFLLREDSRLAETLPGSTNPPAQIVLRDARGFARLAGGSVPAPFVDQNPADGLPDVDEDGRFLSSTGQPLALAPFGTDTVSGDLRDSASRLVTISGDPVYAYSNLDRTILAGVLRDTRELVAEGIPMKAVHVLDTVLGERQDDGSFGSANSGLLDLVHAIGATGDMNELPEAMNLLRTLLEHHEATTMWLELEMENQLDIADRHPEAALRRPNTFFDDLMSTTRKILLVPGLAEDLVVALRDPAVLGLPDAFIKLMSYKKDLVTQADVANGTAYVTPVDRTRGDVAGNQSLQQRLFHLIHDTKGAAYVPDFHGIPLGFIFKIDDLAMYYMLSIIGQAEPTIPSLVQTLTGLSERPSPDELAAFINADQTFGNAQGHEGLDVKDNDGDTLFAATSSGMTDALKPLIQVFYNHGRMDLLFELFDDLHLHWASAASDYQSSDPTAPRYSHLSGIRTYEPMMIDGFQNAKLLAATQKLMVETKDVRTSTGRLSSDMLLILGRKLINKDSTLKTRDGHREVLIDGQRVTPLSPFDLIRAARNKLKSAVSRTSESQQDWDDVVDAVHRIFLKTERTGPESGKLQNPRALPVASALLSFLEDRANAHVAARDLSRWISQDMPQNVEDAITSPEMPAMFDVLYAIEGDQELTDALSGLRDELLAEDKGFQDLLALSGDLLQTLKDARTMVPVVHFLGRELDPDKLLLFTMGSMTQKTVDIDSDEHFLEVARRGMEDAPDGHLYLTDLGRAIRQIHRVNPLDDSLPDAADVTKIVGAISRYLADDQHGLEKFYKMVHNRKLGGVN